MCSLPLLMHFTSGLCSEYFFVLVVLLLGEHLVIKSHLFCEIAQQASKGCDSAPLPAFPRWSSYCGPPSVPSSCSSDGCGTLVAGQLFHLPLVALMQRKLSLAFIFRQRLMIYLVSMASVGKVMLFSCTVESMNDLSMSSWSSFTRMLSFSISSTPASPMCFLNSTSSLGVQGGTSVSTALR